MKPTLIRFEPDVLTRLNALAEQSGNSVAALVRWCVDKSLPVVAVNIERNAKTDASTQSVNS